MSIVNLYLVGYRCTGKTSVGRLLSDAMGWTFVDMDNELVTEAARRQIGDTAMTRVQHFRDLMGQAMRELRGRVPGAEVAAVIRSAVGVS